MSKPLAIIPTYVQSDADVEVTLAGIDSIMETADLDIMVVDDGSPEYFASCLEVDLPLRAQKFFQPFNSGFAKTVNIGLRRALTTGQDAILINADVLFFEDGWAEQMQDTAHHAAVVGGLLLYPNGTIQHSGIYYSTFNREFDHIYRFAPGNIPQAQQRRLCPVTGALMYIRNDTLERVGIFDEDFEFGYEDVDYCFRVFENGDVDDVCIVDPQVRAIHKEAYFTSRDAEHNANRIHEGMIKLATKHAGVNFASFVPTLLEGK